MSLDQQRWELEVVWWVARQASTIILLMMTEKIENIKEDNVRGPRGPQAADEHV